MPVINTNYHRPFSIKWSWPLSVTVFSENYQMENNIRNFNFNRDFLRSTTASGRRGKDGEQQILLFPGGFADMERLGQRRLSAEMVIIVEAPGNVPKDFAQWDLLSGTARQFGAAGVFVFELRQHFIPAWLNQFVGDLSKDNSFIDTFLKYSGDGILLYDREQNWDKPVTQSLDQLQRRISRLRSGAVIPFPSADNNYVAADELMEQVAQIRYELRGSNNLVHFSMHLADAVNRVEYPPLMFEQKSIRDSREISETLSLEAAEMPSVPELPRFLQAKLYGPAAPGAAIKTHLAPRSAYKVSVLIGYPDASYVHAPDSFPDDAVFEKSAATEEPVQICFIADGQEIKTETIILPRRGNSTAVEFDLMTGETTDRFQCQIIALHRNRVIQWVALGVSVTEGPVNIMSLEMTTVLCTRSALSNLANRSQFGAAFIVTEADDEAGITALKMDGEVLLPSSQGARTKMENIKSAIEAAARKIEEYPEDLFHEKNVKLLRTLAMHGEALYQHFTRGQDFIGPLQVVEHQSDFIPINFVYSFGPPAEEADLCEHAITALKEGKCRDCFDKYENPASHICPFGFWGFSKVIEYCRSRPLGSGSDFILKSEPSSGKEVLQILDHTIHGSAAKVEGKQPGLRQKVSETIAGFTNALFPAETWDQWAELTEAKSPDSIVLIVHTDKNDSQLNRVWIGEDPLVQNYLGKKHIAGKKRPLAIVIGCEVADINDQGFDVGSEFLQKGASVVITNFTKIRGTQAAKIVGLLVKFLKEHSESGESFGEVMLKLKQHLLADGLIVSMSLVTYGDADWKFKS